MEFICLHFASRIVIVMIHKVDKDAGFWLLPRSACPDDAMRFMLPNCENVFPTHNWCEAEKVIRWFGSFSRREQQWNAELIKLDFKCFFHPLCAQHSWWCNSNQRHEMGCLGAQRSRLRMQLYSLEFHDQLTRTHSNSLAVVINRIIHATKRSRDSSAAFNSSSLISHCRRELINHRWRNFTFDSRYFSLTIFHLIMGEFQYCSIRVSQSLKLSVCFEVA